MTWEELERALEQPDAEPRRRAAIAIGEQPRPELAPLLMRALGDEDWRVRKEAVQVARHHGVSMGLLDGLIDAICQGENVGLRNAALNVLETLGDAAADALLAALPRVSDNARRFVVEALACSASPRVVRALVEASSSEDANVAAAAIDVLGTLGGPEAEQALRAGLGAQDPFHRLAALDALNRMHAWVPWEALEPLLDDRVARRVALAALGRCGRGEAIPVLVHALSETSRHTVRTAAEALAELYATWDELADPIRDSLQRAAVRARAHLRGLLEDAGPRTRRSAAMLCASARDVEALPGIVDLACTAGLPPSVVELLQRWGPSVVRPLLSVAERADGKHKGTALELACDLAHALRGAGHEDAAALGSELLQALRIASRSDDEPVAAAAVRCLGVWGTQADAPRLTDLALKASPQLAALCGEALERIAEREPDAVVSALQGIELDAVEGPGAAALLRLVSMMGRSGAIDQLQTALSSNSPEVRKAAIDGLVRLGVPQVAELIAFSLTDENADVQAAAARALGRLQDGSVGPSGLDALLLGLRAEADSVRAAAAEALAELGDMRACEPLRQVVREGNPEVVLAALSALVRLQDPDLVDLLVEMLEHPDADVVKQSLEALCQRGDDARVSEGLRIALGHPAWDVRQRAALFVARLPRPELYAAVVERLEHETDDLVRFALQDAQQRLEEER